MAVQKKARTAKKTTTTRARVRALVGPTAKKAVSVDKMVEENLAATVSTNYQKYLRKLMREGRNR